MMIVFTLLLLLIFLSASTGPKLPGFYGEPFHLLLELTRIIMPNAIQEGEIAYENRRESQRP
ncbi:MAG TPA: hypothetical protein DCK76_03520 [Desulfotomaculum sp.]|nr:hypothetical protein [Desulfotomaculum sp.]HBY04781.1 hypothetical protein [Desulfotomaculum sp.]